MANSAAKDTPVLCSTYTFARLLPIVMRPPCGLIYRTRKIQIPKKIAVGTTQDSTGPSHLFSAWPVKRT